MSNINTQAIQSSHPPIWAVNPNDTDWLAWAAIIAVSLAFYLIMFLYGKFDHWADQKSAGTPLAKTIPTLLGIALLYEIFPLDHFSILLPISAILIAVMADWMRAGSRVRPLVPKPVVGDELGNYELSNPHREFTNVPDPDISPMDVNSANKGGGIIGDDPAPKSDKNVNISKDKSVRKGNDDA